jgi:hypothetical protein
MDYPTMSHIVKGGKQERQNLLISFLYVGSPLIGSVKQMTRNLWLFGPLGTP